MKHLILLVLTVAAVVKRKSTGRKVLIKAISNKETSEGQSLEKGNKLYRESNEGSL